MRTKPRKLNAAFEPETRFEVTAKPAVPFRAVLETELERLKRRLLREALSQPQGAAASVALRWAANEAAAIAGTTAYPLLILPELFAEKARAALTKAARQEQVWQRSRNLMAEVA
jgi:hypothetical protein